MKVNKIAISVFFASSMILSAQQVRNKGEFRDERNEFMEKINKDLKEFKEKDKAPKKLPFKMDYTGIDLPKSPDEFKSSWHFPPISQGVTGTCWSFSTNSFLESEIYRLHNRKVKLSEMYIVYWEYVEKTKEFIKTRGKSVFGEGSQSNAVTRIMKDYGAMPQSAFAGIQEGQPFHNHAPMFDEMNKFLQNIKSTNNWNEDLAIATIKSIMEHHIGTPPESFTFEGKSYTPKTFMTDNIKINPADYVDILSLLEANYWKKAVYPVADNWWNSNDYYNVPLEDYINALKAAVAKGYTAFVGGDVSEGGKDGNYDVAMVPSYDIPSDYIDDYARQFRFSNGTTTDDHGIHIVGYEIKNGKYWFLIKDSGSGGMNGGSAGYYYFHEDYIKLKMMNFMVNKSAVEDLLKKFKSM